MRSDRVQIARKTLQLFGSPYLSLKLTEQLEYWSIGMSYSGDQATVGKKSSCLKLQRFKSETTGIEMSRHTCKCTVAMGALTRMSNANLQICIEKRRKIRKRAHRTQPDALIS